MECLRHGVSCCLGRPPDEYCSEKKRNADPSTRAQSKKRVPQQAVRSRTPQGPMIGPRKSCQGNTLRASPPFMTFFEQVLALALERAQRHCAAPQSNLPWSWTNDALGQGLP